MKRFSIFLFVLSFSTVLHAQNCDGVPVANSNSTIAEITTEYKQIIERQMGDNDTVMPANFMEIARCYVQNIQHAKDIDIYFIPAEFIEERPDIVFFIFDSRSIENNEQEWFDLYPQMNTDQIDKLFYILRKEFLRLHQIERKYEKKKESIERKYEYAKNDIMDRNFKWLGVFTRFSTTGIPITEEIDEWYIREQGLAENATNGEVIPISSIDFLSADELNDWKKEHPHDADIISKYEEYFCNSLYNIQTAHMTFPKDSLSTEMLFSYWLHFLEEFYKSREKSNMFQKLALFPMEKYVDEEKKKDVSLTRYQYAMISNHREYEYAEATKYLTLFIQNSDIPRSSQSFLFHLYITVLRNEQNSEDSAYAEAEQAFVDWSKKTTLEDLSQSIENYHTETQFLMADYYLLYGTNNELKVIVKHLLSEFEKRLSSNIVYYDSWYEYLNKMYFSDGFKSDYSFADLQNQLSRKKFNNDEHLVEYATYYCLYKIKHLQPENIDVREIENIRYILDNIERICLNPNSTTFNFCEKDIAIDLKSRIANIYTKINMTKLATGTSRPPKILFVSTFPKETKDSRQMLQFIAGNGDVDIRSLEVFINEERQPVQKFTTVSESTVWKYSQVFDLIKGKNTVIIKCVDVDGREAYDTVSITYNPENYMDRKDYAILFAVDNYSKVDRFNNLEKPIQDAERFAKVLAKEYGFDTLVVRNPTKKTISATIKTYQNKEYGPFDQLLIFYAGHGYLDDFGLGYIVPSDGDVNDDEKLVDYASLAAKINGIRCSHILFICDACHSGSFLTAQTRDINPDIQMQNEVMKLKSRLFLGSCLAKDETPDNSALMDKLCKKLRDQNKDTPIDFYSLIGLTYTIGNTSEEKQKAFGEFFSHEKGGDFFFNRK